MFPSEKYIYYSMRVIFQGSFIYLKDWVVKNNNDTSYFEYIFKKWIGVCQRFYVSMSAFPYGCFRQSQF